MQINDYLLNYENEIINTISSAEKYLRTLPEGELRKYSTTARKKKYSQFFAVNNGSRKYLPKDSNIIKFLAEKMFYQKLLEIARTNRDELEFIRNNITGISTSEILNELPEWIGELIEFPKSKDLLLSSDPEKAKILLDWQNAPYQKKVNRNEGLRHRASDGTMVRSKSEGMIWEKIIQLKIARRYECGIEYEPGRWIFPDFTTMRIDTKIFYHEHCGLMNDPEYVSNFKWKLGIYEKLGIVPWDNLILTFDDVNGNIDMNLIETILRSKLII